MPRPKPRVRPVKGGAIIDGLDEYAREVAGAPPENFNELIADAVKLHPYAFQTLLGYPADAQIEGEEEERALDKLRDIFLLAANAYSAMRNRGQGEHHLAFVARAKQVAGWCKRPIPEMTGLSILEHKARELARLIAMRLFKGEGFVLVVYNEGTTDGFMTWIGSSQRRDTIKMLEELVGKMKEDQGSFS